MMGMKDSENKDNDNAADDRTDGSEQGSGAQGSPWRRTCVRISRLITTDRMAIVRARRVDVEDVQGVFVNAQLHQALSGVIGIIKSGKPRCYD